MTTSMTMNSTMIFLYSHFTMNAATMTHEMVSHRGQRVVMSMYMRLGPEGGGEDAEQNCDEDMLHCLGSWIFVSISFYTRVCKRCL
jgi:hypothetical protein